MTRTPDDLQLILNEMFASKERLTLTDVGRWQEKYPEFGREIVEAYTNWLDLEFAAASDAPNEAATVSEDDKKFIEALLARSRGAATEPLTDLRAEMAEKGIARDGLRGALGVSETLLRKLERRNLKEIPEAFERRLAELLGRSAASVRAFFEQSPTLSPAVRYKSARPPRTVPKQTFAEAVRTDPELSDEEKSRLLNV